jgi:hypothetical protein
MKRKMSELRDHAGGRGRPAVVLGGGPSLPDDLARIPEGAIKIAVNYHAFQLVACEFMVYNDEPESDPRLQKAVNELQTVRVSPDSSSDIVFDVAVWTGFFSSNTAAWLGLWMGCDPVILCGMDCYQGERVYFHPYDHDCPAFHYPLDHYTRPWVEEGRHLLPHVERLRVMSGPLAKIFPLYEVGR